MSYVCFIPLSPISPTISVEFAETTSQEECQALGMESGTIQDDQITASSDWANLKPKEARLNNDKNWAAASKADPWIRVNLLTTTTVQGLIIQGAAQSSEWVETLKVAYKQTSDHDREFIEEDGSQKVSTIIEGFYLTSIQASGEGRTSQFTPDKPGQFPFPAVFFGAIIQCEITRSFHGRCSILKCGNGAKRNWQPSNSEGLKMATRNK